MSPAGHPDWRAPTIGDVPVSLDTVGNPAAGADWTFTVPAGQVRRLVYVEALLFASAAAGNRFAFFRMRRGGVTFFDLAPLRAHVPSSTVSYFWAREITSIDAPASDAHYLAIPPVVLLGGDELRGRCVFIQAGDQWSQIRLLFERLV